MKTNASLVAAGLGILFSCASAPAWVHHSGIMFDKTRVVQIHGLVKEFVWTNPHSSIKLDVTGQDGKVDTWFIEMNGPNNLVHEGWKKNSIRPGDKVTMTVNPLRDGRPGGWYISIVLPDGKSLGSTIGPPTDSAPQAGPAKP